MPEHKGRRDTRGEGCPFHSPILVPHLCQATRVLLNLGSEASVDVPTQGCTEGGHASLEASLTLSSCRESQPSHHALPGSLSSVAVGRPSADSAAQRRSPFSPRLLSGLRAGSAPPFPGPLAGLQLRAKRSRLGSSSSMALLPHYPDVGPSPPRLYRLSAGSARVMRALLITIAETPLTLTAPCEEQQHLLCAGRRPTPAPRSPSLAVPLFPGPIPQPFSPSSLTPSPTLSF